jgi:uncharacterized protein (DUF1499 family)
MPRMVKWPRAAALVLALIALVLLALSGPLVRFDAVSLWAGFGLFRWAAYLGIAAALLAAVVLAVPRLRASGIAAPAFALLLGLAVFYAPFQFQSRSKSVPPINDITTDTANPPQYMTTQRAYPGAEAARQQQKAYADLAPLPLRLPPREAFDKAVKAAEAMGWEVVGRDSEKGMIEAVDTTKWFGFKDDIAIRVAAAPDASPNRSIVDVRSKSRVGRGDLGTNAHRIRAYLERLK